jgi:hypothetical protein
MAQTETPAPEAGRRWSAAQRYTTHWYGKHAKGGTADTPVSPVQSATALGISP